MQLSPKQIRAVSRAHGAVGDASLDDLLGALCRRLSLVPDVRAGVVADARARLFVTGPPSAEALADMLVGALHLAGAGRSPGPSRPPWLCSSGCARVCGCKSKPVAGETTHIRRPVVAEHGAA